MKYKTNTTKQYKKKPQASGTANQSSGDVQVCLTTKQKTNDELKSDVFVQVLTAGVEVRITVSKSAEEPFNETPSADHEVLAVKTLVDCPSTACIDAMRDKTNRTKEYKSRPQASGTTNQSSGNAQVCLTTKQKTNDELKSEVLIQVLTAGVEIKITVTTPVGKRSDETASVDDEFGDSTTESKGKPVIYRHDIPPRFFTSDCSAGYGKPAAEATN